MKQLIYDPKLFIKEPFIECPKCGKQSFGILSVNDNHFRRRCNECFYPIGEDVTAGYYPLPAIKKKIIYLDQFAISNTMKALNPEAKGHAKAKASEFWLELFEKLDKLCKMQLIICPYSNFHVDESLMSESIYDPLKRIYLQLSNGINFYDHETIRREQIVEHAMSWINDTIYNPNLDITDALDSSPHTWQDNIIIDIDLDWLKSNAFIDELMNIRQENHVQLSKIFSHWQSDKNKKFKFDQFVISYGRDILRLYNPIDIYTLLTTEIPIIVRFVKDGFKGAGIKELDLQSKVKEYFLSGSLKEVPLVKIHCMLFAALARKAQSDSRMNPPNRGTIIDIKMISAFLPYCDAMFIDRPFHGYLNEEPLRSQINFNTKLFSVINKNEFISYLDTIEKNASKEHISLLDSIYGNRWQQPYTSIFKSEDR